MFRIGRNTGRTGKYRLYRPYWQIPTVPAGIWIPDRNIRRPCFVNFDIFKGKIVILLNPNSKTLALPSSRTALFLSFFLSHALSQLLCSFTLSANLSLTLSAAPLLCLSLTAALSLTPSLATAALSLTHRCSISHPPLLCLSLSVALSLTLSATLR